MAATQCYVYQGWLIDNGFVDSVGAAAIDSVIVIGINVLMSFCDVTMVQFLPWKRSKFFGLSKGYPSMGLLSLSLATKTLQSFVSVVCQLKYLFDNNTIDSPTTSFQAKIAFSLSITSSSLAVVMGVLLFSLKYQLLKDEDKGASKRFSQRMSARQSARVLETRTQGLRRRRDRLT